MQPFRASLTLGRDAVVRLEAELTVALRGPCCTNPSRNSRGASAQASRAGFDGDSDTRILSWRKSSLRSCQDRGSRRSCWTAASGWCSSPAARLRVAADLGIHPETLRKRVRQTEADAGKRADLLTTEEREELKRLRGEVRELRRANEILKSASVFFAKELDPPRPK
jgi:transposase